MDDFVATRPVALQRTESDAPRGSLSKRSAWGISSVGFLVISELTGRVGFNPTVGQCFKSVERGSPERFDDLKRVHIRRNALRDLIPDQEELFSPLDLD